MLPLNKKLSSKDSCKNLKNEKKCLSNVDYEFINLSGSASARFCGTPQIA